MSWIWLNIPLAAIISAAIIGIPLWLVFKHPDPQPQQAATPRPATVPDPAPADRWATERELRELLDSVSR